MNKPEKNTAESKQINTEEPKRIKGLLDALQKNQWKDDDNLLENLNTIFNELNTLALGDLQYYNDKRQKNGEMSKWTRGVSLIFGTLGALAIILQNNLLISSSQMVIIGSAFFIISAAALTWNRLFGASGGHIRYVIAQFDLGEMIVKFALDWHEWLDKNNRRPLDEEIDVQGAFKLFRDFSEHTYKIVRDETQVWGKSLMDAMEEQYKRSQQK